jgi:hypothetical protein
MMARRSRSGAGGRHENVAATPRHKAVAGRRAIAVQRDPERQSPDGEREEIGRRTSVIASTGPRASRPRRAYVRLFVDQIVISKREIRISGPKRALAQAASSELPGLPAKVLSFVRGGRNTRLRRLSGRMPTSFS